MRRALSTHDVLIWVILIVLCGGLIIFAIMRERGATNVQQTPPQSAMISVHAESSPIEPTDIEIESFTLTDQDGESFTSDAMDGHYWVADFIFTNCAGPCPIMTSAMANLQREYTDYDNLRFVSISVDPDRDTPEVLKAFGNRYGADFDRWSFLTGDYEKIQYLAREVFMLALANPAEDAGKEDAELAHQGPIVHSSRLVLVNPDGKIIDWYIGTDSDDVDELRKALDQLLGVASSSSAKTSGNGG